MPLLTTSFGTAAFKIDLDNGYRSILNGRINGANLAIDTFINYGLGQTTRLAGIDNWYKTPQAASAVGSLRYQIALRLHPRFSSFLEKAAPEAVEIGNRAAAGALRKIASEESKKRLPK